MSDFFDLFSDYTDQIQLAPYLITPEKYQKIYWYAQYRKHKSMEEQGIRGGKWRIRADIVSYFAYNPEKDPYKYNETLDDPVKFNELGLKVVRFGRKMYVFPNFRTGIGWLDNLVNSLSYPADSSSQVPDSVLTILQNNDLLEAIAKGKLPKDPAKQEKIRKLFTDEQGNILVFPFVDRQGVLCSATEFCQRINAKNAGEDIRSFTMFNMVGNLAMNYARIDPVFAEQFREAFGEDLTLLSALDEKFIKALSEEQAKSIHEMIVGGALIGYAALVCIGGVLGALSIAANPFIAIPVIIAIVIVESGIAMILTNKGIASCLNAEDPSMHELAGISHLNGVVNPDQSQIPNQQTFDVASSEAQMEQMINVPASVIVPAPTPPYLLRLHNFWMQKDNPQRETASLGGVNDAGKVDDEQLSIALLQS